ncbi:hypothetical protein L484_010793 [Morus notabilis]|uniref:Uncharacterized protein n=1 Tax=Morus notabilis TaxID=981085 RepID=W9SAN0_9ROSA|nr:hypothetical protein L484_010793 [Morus notabilis]
MTTPLVPFRLTNLRSTKFRHSRVGSPLETCQSLPEGPHPPPRESYLCRALFDAVGVYRFRGPPRSKPISSAAFPCWNLPATEVPFPPPSSFPMILTSYRRLSLRSIPSTLLIINCWPNRLPVKGRGNAPGYPH